MRMWRAGLSQQLLILVLWLVGCARFKPINVNHPEHLQKMAAKLGVEPGKLNWPSLGDQYECDRLDGAATGWTATSVVAGVLGGGAGITTTILDQQTPRWATGSVTVGLAAISALSGYLSTHYAARYTQRCTLNTGGR